MELAVTPEEIAEIKAAEVEVAAAEAAVTVAAAFTNQSTIALEVVQDVVEGARLIAESEAQKATLRPGVVKAAAKAVKAAQAVQSEEPREGDLCIVS
mmetsp:Transcript_11034/g.22277  ORF Transcript_11034/g.22277 Transcript_11034/m.22277 type:complete len:97 (+) Transcript_11034:2-292(+)